MDLRAVCLQLSPAIAICQITFKFRTNDLDWRNSQMFLQIFQCRSSSCPSYRNQGGADKLGSLAMMPLSIVVASYKVGADVFTPTSWNVHGCEGKGF